MEEIQAELSEVMGTVRAAMYDLDNAENCDSVPDLDANLQSAMEHLQSAAKEVFRLQRRLITIEQLKKAVNAIATIESVQMQGKKVVGGLTNIQKEGK